MNPAAPAYAAYAAAWRRRGLMLAVLFSAIAGLAVIDVLLGPADISLATLWQVVSSPEVGAAHTIFWQLRMPQALMAVLVGAALGVSGAEMQTVLDNPLASPFTLGISSAAALGAALTLVFEWRVPLVPDDYSLVFNAFLLALLCTFALDRIAKRARIGSTAIVLFGIALVFALNALLSLIQLLANATALQDLIFWMMGSLARSDWSKIGIIAAALLIVFPFALRSAWQLTALRFGDARAVSLGVDPAATRRWSLLRVSVLASVAVALVGVIGFIGLIAPHIARRLWGEDHRWFLPASAATGSVVLLAASVVSKMLSGDVLIPVGIVTTLVGIPFFLFALTRQRGY